MPSAAGSSWQPVPGMNEESLTLLKHGDTATVTKLHGCADLQRRLRSIGINEGRRIRMVAKHPLSGPVVLEVERRQITIGRGMANKIAVMRGL